MPKDQLTELTQHQRDRLAFIELRVRFVGEAFQGDEDGDMVFGHLGYTSNVPT
jgi:hypothetical protein